MLILSVDPRTAIHKLGDNYMGRPLNKKFFGDPQKPESQFAVTYWNNSAPGPDTGYIVKQLGARRFRCTNGSTDTSDCRLALAVVGEGDMIMQLDQVGNPPALHTVVKISGRTATIETGEKVSWTSLSMGDADQGAPIDITALVAGTTYKIATITDGDWVSIGATTGTAGEVFTATGSGTGTGDTATFVSSGDAPGVSTSDDKPKAEPKVEPKKSMVDKITDTVKETVKNVVSEPESKSYKPRAKKAPARKTTSTHTKKTTGSKTGDKTTPTKK